MRFVDLFAGLGGFHQALDRLGHECVFASEMNPVLASLYDKNFGLKPYGDIRMHHDKVPDHDILCAGFPCQPFSKAGDQKGFDCPQWGDLFDYVVEILRAHSTKYIIIENVPNLMRHDDGKTWRRVCSRLEGEGYKIASTKISPHMLGVPQLRERAIIVGSRDGLDGFSWPAATHTAASVTMRSILDDQPSEAKALPLSFVRYVAVWQQLLDALPAEVPLPSFPIWAMEFGATYPIGEERRALGKKVDWAQYRGSLGRAIDDSKDIEPQLPGYAKGDLGNFPSWKVNFIKQNRAFYARNRQAIDKWLPAIESFAPSFQKLEWNWKDGPRDLWQTIIQFRASGIRAKRPNYAPSLVALTTSQVPVVGWEKRYMTPRECARLQSMGNLVYLPESNGQAYKALGNAVNVDVIAAVASNLLIRNVQV